MAKNIQVLVNTGNQATSQTFDVTQGGGEAKTPTRIKAVPGARYQLQDPAAKNTGPENIRSKRVGKDLHVSLDDSTDADLIIEGYYDDALLSDDKRGLFGQAEDGQLYEYIPADADPAGLPINLADGGSAVTQALGTSAGAAGLVAVAAFNPLVAGAAAVGAAAAGGGGGGGAAAVADTTPPASPIFTVKPNANGTLSVSGSAEAGSVVKVTFPDGSTATATVAADGTYGPITSTQPQTSGTVTANATDAAGNTSPATKQTYADTERPVPPTGTVVKPNADGTLSVSGKAEAGSTVKVVFPDGSSGTTTAGADGSYGPVTSIKPQTSGPVTISATDAAGNSGAETITPYTDTTSPVAPKGVTVNPTGTSASGTAEPGSTVTVKAADGTTLGTATAGSDGKFTVPLSPAQTDGQAVSVAATDAAKNTSPSVNTTAPDTAPPAAPTGVTVNPTGTGVSGTAEPGSIVTVKAADGTTLGTATTGSDGKFTVPLSPAQTNGQTVKVTAADGGGTSAPETAVAKDTTPPGAPTVNHTVNEGGTLTVSGVAEPNSTVSIVFPDRTTGTAVANANGQYELTSVFPQIAGKYSATASDAAGNTSAPAEGTLTSRDTGETAPIIGDASVDAAGLVTIFGVAPPYTTVKVTFPDGSSGEFLVGDDGAFRVTSTTPQISGEVTAIATDADNVASIPDTALYAIGYADNVGGVKSDKSTAASTDDTTPGLNVGILPAGTTPALYVDGVKVNATYDAATGILTPDTALADGKHVLTYTLTQAGVESAESLELGVTVDGKAPVAPTVDATDGSPITGTAEAGSTVTIKDAAGTVIGTATAGTDGEFSVTPATAVADGTVLNATATDAAGNTGPATTVTVDGKAPLAPTLDATDGSPITGTAEAGSTVTIKDAAGTVIGTATAGTDGKFSVTPATAVADGTVLNATATDAAGNVSDPVSKTVDATAPLAPTLDATDGSPITGTAEAGSTVTIKDAAGTVIGTATAGTDGEFSVTPATPVADGTQLGVTATDAAGNTGPATTVTVDGKAPLAPTLDATDGSPITGTAEAGSTVTIKDAAGTVIGTATAGTDGEFSVTPATPVADGTQLGVTATDAAGNTGPATTVTVDGKAPLAPTLDATDGSPITGTAEAGSTVTIKDAAGTVIGTATAGTDGEFSVTPTTPVADGTVLNATATDAAGNTGPATTVTVDGKAPLAPTLDATDGSPITGTAEAGSTVTIKDAAGTVIGTATAGTDGKFSVTPATAVADGTVLNATATDAAGNTGPATTVTVDGKAPLAPTLDATDGSPITGTAEAGSTVTIKDAAGTVIGTATAGTDGEFSVTPTTPVADGTVLNATATDAAGNVSDPVSKTVDATAPATPVLTQGTGVAGGATAAEGAQATGVVTVNAEAGATTVVTFTNGAKTVTKTVDGTGAAQAVQLTAADLATLGDGTISVSATATDAAGNTSTAGTTSFTLDTVAPATPVLTQGTGVADGATAAEATQPTGVVTVNAETGSTTVVTFTNGANTVTKTVTGTGAAQAVQLTTADLTALGNGSISVSATAKDAAGNTSPAGTTSFILDTVAPAVVSDAGLALIDDVGAVTGAIAKGSETDDTRPTFSGTADAQTKSVNVYDGSTLLGSAAVAADGKWSFEPSTPLVPGSHNLTAKAVDAAGNESAATAGWDFKLLGAAPAAPAITGVTDNQGGVTGAIAKGASTDDTTPTLSGTGVAGTTVKVYADGVEVGSATVAADGTWSITTSALSGDGTKVLTAQAFDGAGQGSPATGGYAIGLDTTPPAKPGAPAASDNQGAVQGAVANGATTDDTTPTLAGAGTPGDTIKVYDGATLLGSTTVQPDGSWSFTPSTALSDGSHSITTTATDPAGNTSAASDALAFTVDTSNVVVSIAQAVDNAGSIIGNLSAGGKTDDDTPTLVGTATANAVVTLKEGTSTLGTVTADGNGAWSFTLPTQAEGAHTYTAEAKNAAGTTGTTTFDLTIDKTAPAVPAIGSISDDVGVKQGTLANGASTDDTTPTLSGAGTAGDTIKLYDNGQLVGSTTVKPDGTWSYTPTSPLSEGAHALTVSATDPQGNESAKSPAVNLTVDTSAPAAPAAPSGYTDNVGAVQSTTSTAATTDDTTPGLNVGVVPADTTPTLYVDGNKVPATYDAATGTLTPTTALADGAHTLSYTLTDAAGNESAKSPAVNLTVDTTAPAAPAVPSGYTDNVGAVQSTTSNAATTDDTTPGLNVGVVPADTTPTLYVDGNKVPATYDAATGTLTPTTALADGAHTLAYTLTDAAGNESAKSPALSVTVDTVAPTTPTLALGTGVNNGATAAEATQASGVVTVTAEAGSTTVLTFTNGANTVTKTVTGTGAAQAVQLAAEDLATLGDGAISVSAAATDTAGNTSSAGTTSFTLDTSAAAPTLALANDTGTSSTDGITNNGAVNVSGLESGASWQYSTNGGSTWTTGTGSSFTLAAGSYVANSIQVKQTDAAGNASITGNLAKAVTVDTSVAIPSVVLANDTGTSSTDGITNNGAINVSGLETGASWQYSTNNGSTWTTGTGSSFTLAAGTYAANSIQVKQTDVAGNISSAGKVTGAITVDNTATTFTSSNVDLATTSDDGLSTTDNATTVHTPTVTATFVGVSKTSGLTVTFYDDKDGSGTYNIGDSILALGVSATVSGGTATANTTLNLADGSYALKAFLADASGNVSSTSATLDNANKSLVVSTPISPTSVGGSQVNDGLGYSLNSAGDFNGDGIQDFIVSAPHNQYGATVATEADVYLIYGTTSGLPNLSNIDNMTSTQGIKISGGAGYAGLIVSSAGDLNGDGKGDVIIASHLNDSAYVLWGRNDQPATVDLTAIGTAANANGFALKPGSGWFADGAAAADLNKDGYSDLIIGDSAQDYGRTYVIYGHSGAWTNITGGANGVTGATGNVSTFKSSDLGYLGDHLNAVGDINGDGYQDFLVTAPASDVTFTDGGAAYLIFGKAGGYGTTSVIDLGGTGYQSYGIRITGTQDYEYLGGIIYDAGNNGWGDAYYGGSQSISSIGDFNGDGVGDMIIGSPAYGPGSYGFDAGRAYVVYGHTGSWSDMSAGDAATTGKGFIVTASNIGADANLGIAVNGGGDYNKDGYADFLVTASNADTNGLTDNGAVWLVFGKAGGFSGTVDLTTLVANGQALMWSGTSNSEFMGTNAGIGDWNKDGYADVAISRYEATSNGVAGAGAFKIYYGNAVGVKGPTGTTPVTLDLNGDGQIGYGHVVMDVNGDGQKDLTAWTDATDGVLVWDKLGDGVVHDNSQYAFSQYGGNTDLQGLAVGFDTNQDGSFDSMDALFKQFSVWQDANQNGVSEAGEVKSLADVGITSINLTSDGVQRNPAEGVAEFGQTSATLANGSTVLVADAGFDFTSLSALVQQANGTQSVDLSQDAAANTLEIRLSDVLAADQDVLVVKADTHDVVQLDTTAWVNTGTTTTVDAHTYAVWTHVGAHLLLDTNVTVYQPIV